MDKQKKKLQKPESKMCETIQQYFNSQHEKGDINI